MAYKDLHVLVSFLKMPDDSLSFTLALPASKPDEGIDADVKLDFVSKNFDNTPPSGVSVGTCTLGIPSSAFKIDSAFANLLIPLFMGTIEGVACEVITSVCAAAHLLSHGRPRAWL